jgi:hypothetical protein
MARSPLHVRACARAPAPLARQCKPRRRRGGGGLARSARVCQRVCERACARACACQFARTLSPLHSPSSQHSTEEGSQALPKVAFARSRDSSLRLLPMTIHLAVLRNLQRYAPPLLILASFLLGNPCRTACSDRDAIAPRLHGRSGNPSPLLPSSRMSGSARFSAHGRSVPYVLYCVVVIYFFSANRRRYPSANETGGPERCSPRAFGFVRKSGQCCSGERGEREGGARFACCLRPLRIRQGRGERKRERERDRERKRETEREG